MPGDPNDPTPPPPLPTYEEVQELSKRDRVRSVEAEIKTTDDPVKTIKARNVGKDVGRVTFRIDGEDIRFTVFQCYECSALFLKEGADTHGRWHERLARGRA